MIQISIDLRIIVSGDVIECHHETVTEIGELRKEMCKNDRWIEKTADMEKWKGVEG